MREKVSARTTKKSGKTFDSQFIVKDFTDNKMVSHLRLQSELSTNPKYVHSFSKRDNYELMCAAYGLTVPKNKKAEVAALLREKILSCNGMSCPEVFRNYASQHQPPTSQAQPSTSRAQPLTSRAQPPTSTTDKSGSTIDKSGSTIDMVCATKNVFMDVLHVIQVILVSCRMCEYVCQKNWKN